MKLKSKKSALLLSFTSLLLCFAMLAGSTFAWFTDTATTGVNKIVAGNLKVDIVDAANTDKSLTDADGKLYWTQKVVGENGGELKAVETEGLPLWEPGVTFLTQGFKIKNGGNLALKWKMAINKENVENGKVGSEVAPSKSLLEVIDFSVVKSTDENATAVAIENFVGELKEKNTVSTDTYYIKGHMQKEAGNDYQNLTLDGITITVYATQLNYENDSFGPDYDKDAPLPLVATRNELNTTITRNSLKDEDGKIAPVEVTLGNLEAEDIVYDERDTGYTGKGVMLGNTNLNWYNAEVPEVGAYSFTFKDGVINSAANTYQEPDGRNGPKNSSVYMLVPGNSDVVFENMTFNGVVSFDIQKYTAGWSNLNSLTFKNCIFNGLIVGTCPADHVTFDDCTFTDYTNANNPNSSNPIWWRSEAEGQGTNANPIQSFTFINNTVTSTRPIKIERVGNSNANPVFTFKNNTFNISARDGDTNTKNMAINIGNTGKYTLIDDNNTIEGTTAALYTALLAHGENQYNAISGNKVLDGNGNNKTITAKVWKTTTGETFEMKTID